MPNILELIQEHVKNSVPDPTVSESEFDRRNLFDIGACTAADLRRELAYLRVINHLVDSEWHRSREDAISSELRLRHDRDRRRDSA